MRLSKLDALKTLHKYLTAQVLASLLLTVAVFTFVLLLGSVIKEILSLLIAGHAPLGLVVEAIALLIPFLWVFALPMGMLTATLLVFGRFSADQELTAARASGISLISLVMPILFLSLICCALSAWFSMDLGPRSRVQYVALRNQLLANLGSIQFPEDRPVELSTNYIFSTSKYHDGKLENVTIWCLDHNTIGFAPRGSVVEDTTNQQLILNLFDVRTVTMLTNGAPIILSADDWPISLPLNTARNQASKPKISDMTFRQLHDELHRLQQLLPRAASTNGTQATVIEARELPENVIEQIRVEMQRQIAFSFAPFGFALVGIPLGIRVHRRETNIGVAIALALVLVYYSFIILAQELSFRPELFPHLIVWLPDFVFQGAGALLLWRANRGI